MKNTVNRIPGKTVNLFLLSFGLLLASAGTSWGQCLNVDLQAVSIDPSSPVITPTGTIQLVVEMKNNGPCPIPTGEARFTVTFSDAFIKPAKSLKVVDNCSPARWKLFNTTQEGGFYSLTFKNDAGPLPAGGLPCSLSFNISGKGIDTSETIQVTLRSSLTGTATTGDVNGTNQFANLQMKISGKAPAAANTTPTVPVVVPVKPVSIAEINVTADKCNALLNWKTASDNNLESIEVEYGSNEAQFAKIGDVAVRQNAAGSAYDYKHDQGNGRGYYRLKIIEKDGKSSYSKIVSVETKCAVKKGFAP